MADLGKDQQNHQQRVVCWDSNAFTVVLLFVVCDESYSYSKYSFSGCGTLVTFRRISSCLVAIVRVEIQLKESLARRALSLLLHGKLGDRTSSALPPAAQCEASLVRVPSY